MNVALGRNKDRLAARAAKEKTKESTLARALIVVGLDAMDAGKLRYTGPTLIPAEAPRRKGGSK